MSTAEPTDRVALVTGATGFVGSHLVRRLIREKWQVHVICRESSNLPDEKEFNRVTRYNHDGSTENMIEIVATTKPTVVFHLASLFLSEHTAKDVQPLLISNVQFGTQLLEAMRIQGISRFINTGTSWQHYNNEDYNPVCLYAATKQAFESVLEYYVKVCRINSITLKLYDTYGPHDQRKKLFYLLKNAAETGTPLDMSAGEQLIDLVHIDDVIEAFIIAANRLMNHSIPSHECYAVSSGQPIRLRDLVELYSEITGKIVPVNWGARPYREREVMRPWNKGVPIKSWAPKVELTFGLKGVFEYLW